MDLGQDILTNEKTKEAYHKEAALFINTAERYRSENQDEAEATNTLSFLTRGMHILLYPSSFLLMYYHDQAFSSSQLGQSTMPFDLLKVFSLSSPTT